MKFQTLFSFRVACFIFAGFSLLSCECVRNADDLVLDDVTQLPIDSVLVTGIENVHYETYSDSTGSYFISTGMMGTLGGCPDMKTSFSKKEYHDVTVVNPFRDNVYMKKK